jgi:outer membrane protein assembly factor BamD (BamD/ComL family)
MRSVFARLRRALGFLPILWIAATSQASDPYTEVDGEKKPLIPILHPAESTPAEQLARADKQYQDGKLKKAGKSYRALVKRWPRSPEAVKAQASYASVLVSRGKIRKAFESYQELVENYAGSFPYEKVLAQQLQIAHVVATKKKGKFLFFPGLKDPETAIEMYEKIVKNGPQWEFAPQAQMRVGRIQEEIKEFDSAIASYLQTMIRYPGSPFAEEAAFGRIRCLAALSDVNENDLEVAEDGAFAIGNFNTKYPDSRFSDDVERIRFHLERRRAHAAYKIAYFYDKTARKPKAALQEYQKMVEKFKSSEWTDLAKQRIDQLQMELEGTSEE